MASPAADHSLPDELSSEQSLPPLAGAALAFVSLALLSAGLLLLTARLNGVDLLPGPSAGWFAALDGAAAAETVANAAEVVAALLAIAITVVAIVLELAANRYSHLITRLFIRAPTNIIVLSLYVLTTLLCLWSVATTSPATAAGSAQVGFGLTMGLITVALLSLLPYMYFVFSFLSPISIIQRIRRHASEAVKAAVNGHPSAAKTRALLAIDELQDVTRSAIQSGDRSIAMAGVHSLRRLLMDYEAVRDQLGDSWFALTPPLLEDGDFIALADDALAELAANRTWYELKIFRQLTSLMAQSVNGARDVANLIAIDTRRLAEFPGRRRPELLTLCIRAFNSYLRTSINAADPRTAYYVFNQYRLVAESVLHDDDVAPEVARHRVIEIAGHIREYGQLSHRLGMSFPLESAAHDVSELIDVALVCNDPLVDPLLDCLLELDLEIRAESEEESLLGVRRAQLQTAAALLYRGQEQRARRIAADLGGERFERLRRLRDALEQDDRPQFWELTDRGANFSYLEPERRQHLATLFAWLEAQRNDELRTAP